MFDVTTLLTQKEHEHAQLSQAYAELQRRLQEVQAALLQAQGAVQVLRTLVQASQAENGMPALSEVAYAERL